MTTVSRQPAANTGAATDPLQLIDVDHVRFFVGNAKQAAYFYANTFGFTLEEVSDLTTGSRDAAHYLLTQGNIRFLLTTALSAEHPASRHVSLYGDGVKDVAFTVHDAIKTYEQTIKNGATSAREPWEIKDERGTVVQASIRTYGEVHHTFVSRAGQYALPSVKQGGLFMPGFKKVTGFGLNDFNKKNPVSYTHLTLPTNREV